MARVNLAAALFQENGSGLNVLTFNPIQVETNAPLSATPCPIEVSCKSLVATPPCELLDSGGSDWVLRLIVHQKHCRFRTLARR